MGVPHLLCIALFVAILPACKNRSVSGSEIKEEETSLPAGRKAKILESLTYIYYRGNDLPPPVTEAEITSVRESLGSIQPEEKKHLNKIFADEIDLYALANRDTDGDGIKDFRVSHYFGKFHEGDLDLDGDGILNIHDSEPYDKEKGGKDSDGDGIPNLQFRDVNVNKIPDHIDFAITMRSRPDKEAMSQIQLALFTNHKIAMVERDADFNLSTVQAVSDTIQYVFRKKFNENPVLPTLRTVATEGIVLLEPEEGGETNAMVISPIHSLIIYSSGLNAAPLVRLGLLVHEIGHNIQYSLDYRHHDLTFENNRTYYPQPRYMNQMAGYGWTSNTRESDQWQPFEIFTPVYEIVRPKFYYRQKTPAYWEQWMNDAWERTPNNHLDDPKVVENHVVSDYSLSDPFEWTSDNQIAYLYAELEAVTVKKFQGQYDADYIRKKIETSVYRDWPGFKHSNITGAPHLEKFRQKYPMLVEHRKEMAERYIDPLLTDGGFSLTSSALPMTPNPGQRLKRKCGRHP